MKTTAPRNCIIGYLQSKFDVALFHVNERGDIACAINRDANGQVHISTSYGATTFKNSKGFDGYAHIHNHWIGEVEGDRSVIVDSHCIDPTKLNSGDLRRLAKKTAKMCK